MLKQLVYRIVQGMIINCCPVNGKPKVQRQSTLWP